MQQQYSESLGPASEKSQAAVALPPTRQFGTKPGVLVVDDEHLVRIMVRLGLERYGFEVRLAASGREAIDLYRENRENTDVVLLDVRMPGLDGPQTLDALRRMNPDVLACFMSGDTGAYTREDLLKCGAAHFVAKPFSLDQLANILLSLLLDRKTELAEPNRETCLTGSRA